MITIFGTLRRPPAEPVSAETIIPFATFILVLVGAGAWLLRHRRVVQRWLDEPGAYQALRQRYAECRLASDPRGIVERLIHV